MPPGNLTRTAADSQLRSDAIALLRNYAPAFSDTNSLTDAILNNINSLRTFSDLYSLTDATAAQFLGTSTQLGTGLISLSDTALLVFDSVCTIPLEGIAVSDAQMYASDSTVGIVDTNALSDGILESRVDAFGSQDSVDLADSQNYSAIFQATLVDLETFTDVVDALVAAAPTFGDSNSLSDSISVSLAEFNQNLPLFVICSDELPLEDEDVDDGDCMEMPCEVRVGYK